MEMIAEKVKNILNSNLQAITYISELPTDVDNCIALQEAGGPHGTYFAKDRFDTPYLKVLVRNRSYQVGYELIVALKNALASYTNHQEFGLVLVGDIMYFGRDDARRNLFQLTFKVFSQIGG